MRAGGVEATLRMAHDLTRPPGQVIFNADRGPVQFHPSSRRRNRTGRTASMGGTGVLG